MTPPEIELRKIEYPTDIGIELPNGYRLFARIGRPENAAEDPIPAIPEFPSYRGRDSEKRIENKYAFPLTSAVSLLDQTTTREPDNPLRLETDVYSSEARLIAQGYYALAADNDQRLPDAGTASERKTTPPMILSPRGDIVCGHKRSDRMASPFALKNLAKCGQTKPPKSRGQK